MRNKVQIFLLAFLFLLMPSLLNAGQIPKVKSSLKSINFSNLSVNEIMAAGQLGGQLYPTFDITYESLNKGKERANKLKEDNLSFARAIEEWNKHNYQAASSILRKHLQDYPDSPWASEAMLHLGCDANYNGRYSEAEDYFQGILNKDSSSEYEGAKKMITKAKIRLGILKFAENNLGASTKYFSEAIKTGSDWREKTYASHWLQRLNRYTADSRAMMNCGVLALAEILEKDEKFSEASELRSLIPDSNKGYSLFDLRKIGSSYGYDFVGLKVSKEELKQLPLPLIIQIDGKKNGDGGHYWVLRKLSSKCQLFDPQEKRLFNLTPEELQRDWKGIVLAVQKKDKVLNIGIRLTDDEMNHFCGGCCGIPKCEENLGATGSSRNRFRVNMLNMNLYMSEIPLSYPSQIGPSVEINLSYNSQSAISYYEPFGNKWQFNYASFLVVDTGGQVTIFMPDGRRDVYSPDGNGGYTKPFGIINTLTRIEENHFKLELPDGTILEYAIPSGTNSLQPFLVKITTRFGQSLEIGYNDDVMPNTITDSLGRITGIFYNSKGLVERVVDPFGRSALFDYDNDNNLIYIKNIGGYVTQYAYDDDKYITSVSTQKATWNVLIEPADGIENGENAYPPPQGAMWENYRVTITDPANGKEEYYYNGKGNYSWHVTPKNYIAYLNSKENNYVSDLKTKVHPTIMNGYGRIEKIERPDGGSTEYTYDTSTGKPATITDSHGHVTNNTYNPKGMVLTAKTPKGIQTINTYAANDIDLLTETVKDPNGNVLQTNSMYNKIVYTYVPSGDGVRNVQTITDRKGNISSFTYTPYGQIKTSTDALTHVTTSNYYDTDSDPNKTSLYQLKETVRNGKVLSSFTYDNKGRVKTSTDPSGITLTYEYNDLNQKTKVIYPDSKFELYNYSNLSPGLLDSFIDRSGLKTEYTYDILDRVVQVKYPDGTTVKCEYDANGNLTKLIDANGVATSFEYDGMNRLLKKTYVGTKTEQYTYDTEGLVQTYTNGRNIVTTYSYDDADDNLTKVDYSDSTPDITFTYDGFGRVKTRADAAGTHTWTTYDANNNLVTFNGPWTNDTINYSYDALNRTTVIDPQLGETVTYVFDTFDRLSDVKPSTRTFTYSYTDAKPYPDSLLRPNNCKTYYTPDPLGRLETISNKNNSTQQIIRANAFHYSAQDLIDTETITNGDPIAALANSKTAYSYNNLNQLLTSSPDKLYEYDDDGNMTKGYTSDGYQFTAEYDAANQLKSIWYIDPADGQTYKTEFTCSGDGFVAIEKNYRGATLLNTTQYVRSGRLVIQEQNASNQLVRSFVWGMDGGGGIGGLLEMKVESGSALYSYIYDGKGNVSAVLDSNQVVAASYTYDPFGRLLSQSGTLDQPYMFSTKQYYPRLGLSYFGFRFYSPVLGRWINRDPLREEGGLNLYGYVGNNPVSNVDPFGLSFEMVFVNDGGITWGYGWDWGGWGWGSGWGSCMGIENRWRDAHIEIKTSPPPNISYAASATAGNSNFKVSNDIMAGTLFTSAEFSGSEIKAVGDYRFLSGGVSLQQNYAGIKGGVRNYTVKSSILATNWRGDAYGIIKAGPIFIKFMGGGYLGGVGYDLSFGLREFKAGGAILVGPHIGLEWGFNEELDVK